MVNLWRNINMLDGNLMALEKYEREIEEKEKRYDYFIAQVESILGNSIDNLIAEFNAIAKDNEIEMSLIDYLKDR